MNAAAGAPGLLGWLEATPLAMAMRSSLWLYPIVEIFHIVGFAILVGAVMMFDLRLLGWSRSLPVAGLARHVLPWSAASLVLIVPADLLMFSAHPRDFVENRVFLLKLALIGLAGFNAVLFHRGVYRSVARWNTDIHAPASAQLNALASLTLWIAVICCGRLLACT